MACRSCRPPTPASPRCRSWSTAPSRSPIRRCRPSVGYSGEVERNRRCDRRRDRQRSAVVLPPPSPTTPVTGAAIPGAALTTTKLSALTTAITTADSFTVNGKTIAFASSGGNVVRASGATLDLTNATVGDLLGAVDAITGASVPSTLGGTKLSPEHRYGPGSCHRRHSRHADGAWPDGGHHCTQRGHDCARRSYPDHRCNRQRHRHQHHLR